MEGISCADDMRLLYERIEDGFSFRLVRIWFYGGRKSDTINVRSILGVIDEAHTPIGHQQAVFVFVSRPDRLNQMFDTRSQ
jgi:hypothetical protein